ncbi:hypothetical protein CPB84DRAFT_1852236 [Gymnopilus junonius]|uniref:Uncharacterized protein n=1 Tax=Gymnopilus junonius TaxID=109634 RepID=A0A9P5NAT8_GYMJU|nr:hypothetical protein CPB84DRAFT_1852236 [Gymnopilus junonius]
MVGALTVPACHARLNNSRSSVLFHVFSFFLFVSLSSLSSSHNLPLHLLPGITNDLDRSLLNPAANPDFFGQRSIYNIIWSCLVDDLCLYMDRRAPQPSSPKRMAIYVSLRAHLAIMGYLLLAPEMVIIWVARQYIAVLEISQRHSDRGWTKTHAFFLVMGGFMLYENNQPIRTLEYREFEELLEQEKIDWPSITEEEINDKSKGDYLSKAAVLLQTSWFIAQCIVRGRYRLAVTELEVMTLAFTAITIVIYSLWWHKPLDIRVAVPVHLKEGDHITASPITLEKISSLSESGKEIAGVDAIDTEPRKDLPRSPSSDHTLPPSRTSVPELHISTKKSSHKSSESLRQSSLPITTSPHPNTQSPIVDLHTQWILYTFPSPS